MQKEILEHGLNINRRRFLSRLSLGIGSAALGSLIDPGFIWRWQRRRIDDDGPSPFCAESKKDHLPVPKWSTFTT